MLTLLPFYAQALVQSVALSLAFMIKELSHHVSHEIGCNLSEFYNYYLVYYHDYFVIIYAANNS